MFFRKKEDSNQKPFDVDSWKEFVRFLAIQRFAKEGDKNREFSSDKVFINYKYLNVQYTQLIYQIKRKDGIPISISFWLPETDENKWMDCRMINRCNTTNDAIRYIANLSLEN
jgi:hypothetical protein